MVRRVNLPVQNPGLPARLPPAIALVGYGDATIEVPRAAAYDFCWVDVLQVDYQWPEKAGDRRIARLLSLRFAD